MKSKKEKMLLVLYTIFAKNLPQSRHFPIAKKIRVFFARLIMRDVGRHVNIEKGAIFNGQVSIGDYSGIGVDCEMNGPVTIGRYVNMGPEVVVYTRNHATSRTDIPMQRQGYDNVKHVVIGDDVWLGRRVIILPGVHIGEGCVIGAGAVVAKNIYPYSVVVGNPARIVKIRKDLLENE
jgi:maltose O-acetyltransferase